MKIIKIGKIPPTPNIIEVAKCCNCKTEVEFNKDECKKISWACGATNTPPYILNFYYIDCPHCKHDSFMGHSKDLNEETSIST